MELNNTQKHISMMVVRYEIATNIIKNVKVGMRMSKQNNNIQIRYDNVTIRENSQNGKTHYNKRIKFK